VSTQNQTAGSQQKMDKVWDFEQPFERLIEGLCFYLAPIGVKLNFWPPMAASYINPALA